MAYLFLMMAASCLGAANGQAQTAYRLLGMTNSTWQYNFSGSNLGSTWRGTNFDDSSWLSGRGVFALETDNQLVLQQTNTIMPLSNGTQRITTYYFRTHFFLTNDPFEVSLIMTNLVDDGMVAYVNGVEFTRLTMPAAPAPVTFVTTATTSLEASYQTATLPGNLLRKGDNLLAVEVHNASSTSSDIVFGAAVSAIYPTPTLITITNQPTSRVVLEATSVTLSVVATGLPRYHQWYKNGSPIQGATSPDYLIPIANVSDSGTYWLTLSNAVSFVESAHVDLTVIGDTNGPTMNFAEQISSNQILVSFSETLAPATATSLPNYAVMSTTGEILPIGGVSLQNGSNVVLTTDRLSPGINYIVVANEIHDVSMQSNSIAPNSMVPLARSLALLDEYSFYYFYNPFVTQNPPLPGNDNPNLGSSWREPDYLVNQGTNNFWGDNDLERGAFYSGGAALPAEKGTELSSSIAPIVYFRAPLYFPGSPLGAVFSLDYLIKDGAAVYSDGAEVFRVNLPPGDLFWNTRALASSDLSWKTGVVQPDFQMGYGWNTVAAELHSFIVPQTNMAFALRISAKVASLVSGPVVFTRQPASHTVLENSPVTFSFMAAGPAWFQWYRDGLLIPGATNPVYVIPSTSLSMDGTQFSVMAWNQTSSSMSSNAVLRVLPDFTPPQLVSAYASSSNQILVSFSKPVDKASATNLANYVLTNGVGPNLTIQRGALTNGTNVILEASGGSGFKPYVLVVNNIKDTTSSGNPVPPNSAVTVGISISIPIDVTWKYDASGSDRGTAWRNAGYDDGGWSTGPGLLYNEGSELPAPKGTLLPLSDVSGRAITNYYFRNRLILPVGTTNASASLRHVIDDGVVLYFNGTEIHRFNMAAGIVTATTFANVSVDNAVFSGPYPLTLTNLIVSGENVLGAEVHQINATSADMCFGAEMSINAPSIPFAVAVPPRVALSRNGGVTRLGWIGTGFTLQRATTLNGTNTVWEDVNGANSPYLMAPTNAAGFYRLKK